MTSTTPFVFAGTHLGSVKSVNLIKERVEAIWMPEHQNTDVPTAQKAIDQLCYISEPDELLAAQANGDLHAISFSDSFPQTLLSFSIPDLKNNLSQFPISLRSRPRFITGLDSLSQIPSYIVSTLTGKCGILNLPPFMENLDQDSPSTSSPYTFTPINLASSGGISIKGFPTSPNPCLIDAFALEPNSKASFLYGGQENTPKLYDLSSEKVIFTAKNVRHTKLNLREPVWTTGLGFLTTNTFAEITEFAQLRIYDIRSTDNLNRPVKVFSFKDYKRPFNTIHVEPNNHNPKIVLIGDKEGRMFAYDIVKGAIAYSLRGVRGSLRAAAYHPDYGYGITSENTSVDDFSHPGFVISGGLDRHIRMHRCTDRHGRRIVKDIYTKSMISSLIWRFPQSTSSEPIRSKRDRMDGDESDDDLEEIEQKSQRLKTNSWL